MGLFNGNKGSEADILTITKRILLYSLFKI